MWLISHLIRYIWILKIIRSCSRRSRGGRQGNWDWNLVRKITSSSRTHSFIKVSSVGLDELLGHSVVELPSFVLCWIPYKNSLLHVGTKSCPFVLLNVDIGKTSKYSE